MSKSILVLFLSLSALSGLSHAASLYVSGAGQFSPSDTPSAIVAPSGLFSFRFTVDSNSIPVTNTVTPLGFDLSALSFTYTLNGASVNAVPSEVRFNTLANGGLFDVTIGSGLNASIFSFQGPQAFSGTTAAPTLNIANYSVTSFTFSDPTNFDAQATNLSASVTATPEPSSALLLLCGSVAFLAVPARRFLQAR